MITSHRQPHTLGRSEALAETIETYDRNALQYAERYATVDTSSPLHEFLAMLPEGSNRRVLDAGCGSGRDLARMTAAGVTATGLDLSLEMLAIAETAAPQAKVVHGDLRSLPFDDGSFEGVWSFASFLHLGADEFTTAFCEVARVLVPDGVVFVSLAFGRGGEWRSASGGRRWFRYYQADDVAVVARNAGLDVIRVSTDPGVAEGTWVNLLARRGDPHPEELA